MAPPGPGKLDERRRSLIGRREILDQATRLGLNPHVIEKDYVLGWVLAGINQHPALAESWVFKGGTCLKKCYFETYRFSEDLDFTLTAQSHLDEGFLHGAFTEIAGWIYEQTGIELSDGGRSFEIYLNSRGKSSCQGRLSYRGPVSPRSGGLPRLKLDLTADEVLVLPPLRTPIFHPYSDAPKDDISVLAYAYEEAFGEKVRALAERTRPRDLYDVVNLFRNDTARPSPAVLLDVLGQKCAFKGIAVPALADLEPQKPNLEGAWEGMLGHQLPALPPVEAFWDELPVFLRGFEMGRRRRVPPLTRWAPGRPSSASAACAYPSPGQRNPISRSSALPQPTACASTSTTKVRPGASSLTHSGAHRKTTSSSTRSGRPMASTAATASTGSKVRAARTKFSSRATKSS